MKEVTSLKQLIEQYDVKKGGYIHFIGNCNKIEQDAIKKLIDNYLGKVVAITTSVSPFIENSQEFPSCIRVLGRLETNGTQYRVISNDGNSYSYFYAEHIIELGSYQEGMTFKDLAVAVIGLKFN